jgi:hypothetical protein
MDEMGRFLAGVRGRCARAAFLGAMVSVVVGCGGGAATGDASRDGRGDKGAEASGSADAADASSAADVAHDRDDSGAGSIEAGDDAGVPSDADALEAGAAGTGGDALSADAPSDTGAFKDYVRENAAANCAHKAKCGVVKDEASCAALAVTTWPQGEADVAAGRIRYDGAAGAACLASVRAETCRSSQRGDYDPNEPCTRVFTGTLAVGSACSVDNQCAGGFCRLADGCGVTTCCTGTCVAETTPFMFKPIGAACAGSDACVFSAYCALANANDAMGTCQKNHAAGATCAPELFGRDCAPQGSRCFEGVCHPPAARGQDCSAAFCDDHANDYCDPQSKQCKARVAVGGSCGAGDCVLYAPCDAHTLTCVERGLEGAPCTNASDDCAFGLECTNGACAKEVPRPACEPT